jgi:hypothetical protein
VHFPYFGTDREITVMLGSGREVGRGGAASMTADGGLATWAEAPGRRQAKGPERGGLRFAFYGRVSTEDWQDSKSSRARQREQAGALVRGHGAGHGLVPSTSKLQIW